MGIPSLAVQLAKQLCVFDNKTDSKSDLVKKKLIVWLRCSHSLFCEDFYL